MTLAKAVQIEFGRGSIVLFKKTSRKVITVLKTKKIATAPKRGSKKKIT
jgi:hypothetical protein